ncbi:glycosyltransferase [Flavobacterium sp. SM15]|uniref:glycosyltransferase family 2 protein n=1 Tax=Flavobacterium sp. SM15 TaxID=2908005 RepID=UPI001EDBEDFD|nr:glycosyltransferase [Flavobacterium sp. SM15]
MKFTLIICTYKRPQPIIDLLESVKVQRNYPDEILIIDGSPDDKTKLVLEQKNYTGLIYYKVSPEDRGLTRQRNFGISKIHPDSEVVFFLDDDTILEETYFTEILKTYKEYPNALGVGGYITNEVEWQKVGKDYKVRQNDFSYDGWVRKEAGRFIWRKFCFLDADKPPGFFPEFSHGRSISFLPPSGKTYRVEQLMGGVSSFKVSVFNTLKFSTFFEGYGLYEDADFTLRLSKLGELYVNTNAGLGHFHDSSGRPNQYQYGKMVVRNGWYVWRVKFPRPSFKAIVKWHLITLILTGIRFVNVFTTSKRKEAFTEALGRTVGWFKLFFNAPKQI